MAEYEAPDGMTDAGKALWAHLTEFEPEPHEVSITLEAVRTVDLLEELDSIVRADGAVIESPQGLKAHPAAVESGTAAFLTALRAGVMPDPTLQLAQHARDARPVARTRPAQ
jgi:hypothetical protein